MKNSSVFLVGVVGFDVDISISKLEIFRILILVNPWYLVAEHEGLKKPRKLRTY